MAGFGENLCFVFGHGSFSLKRLLWFWIDACGVSEYVAPIINLLVTVPLNFLLNKFWAFKAK